MVLSAPVGFGKSTLLANWAAADERPFAWVSLDSSDNDAVQLLTSIALAVSRVRPIDAAFFSDLAAPGISILGRSVPRLVASLRGTEGPMVLVLNNLHEVTSPQGRDAIGLLIDLLPDEIQVAVASRHRVWLASGRHLARGEVLEIGADDLAFNGVEAAELLRVMGSTTSSSHVENILQVSEGWPAGLYLAMLGSRAEASAPQGIDPSAPPRVVADFVRSEVLSQLPPAEATFMRRIAVLDEVSAAICDFVLEVSDSASALESLVRTNMFIVPLDSTGGWYRLHSLIRGVLIDDLMSSEPDVAAVLYRRASDWWRLNGSAERTVRHANATGDRGFAAQVLVDQVPRMYNDGELVVVDRWIREFGDRDIESFPALAALGGVTSVLCGRPIDAVRWATQLDGIDSSSLPSDQVQFFEATRAALSATLCRHGVDEMRVDAEVLVASEPEWGRWRPTAVGLLGVAHWLQGDEEGSRRLFAESIDVAEQLGLVDPLARMSAHRALVSMDRGDWAEAEIDVERARSVVRSAGLHEYDLSATVEVASARLAIHNQIPEGARSDLLSAMRKRVLTSWACPWAAVWLRLEMATAYLALAGAGDARILVHEIDDLLYHRPNLGVLNGRVDALNHVVREWRRDTARSVLSAAELRLLPYLQTHLTLNEIGQRLHVSRNTVSTQAASIFRKLRVSGRSAAVSRARELGLLEPNALS